MPWRSHPLCFASVRRASAYSSVVACAVVVACCAAPRAAFAQTTANDSTATLLWTAPGDDGTSGRANRYEMRYRSVAISGTDTLAWWNSGTAASGLPSPGAAGVTDSVQVRGLDPSKTWYFVLRTGDEVPNWSGWSNVAIRTPYADRIAPATIQDLASPTSLNLLTPTFPAGTRSTPPRN